MDDRLLRELTAAETDEQRAAIIAEAGIATVSPASQVVARRCVILHWFDAEIVAALCPEGMDGAAVYDELTALPFIEKVPWGVSYHQLTRVGLLARYTANDPTELVTGARLAAPVYTTREAELAQGEALFCLIVAGETAAASKWLDALLDAREDLSTLGALFDMQDEAEAIPFVQGIHRSYVHWFARGVVRYRRGDWNGARAGFDRAIELNPQYAAAYTNRGLLRAAQGDPAGARADYDRAIELDPQYAAAYTNRGLLRSAQGDPAGARADYDRAIALNPQEAAAYYNRGLLRAAQGDPAGARADYDRAIELDPQYAVAWAGLADAARTLGDKATYREAIERALALSADADAYNRACIVSIAGDIEQALVLLAEALMEQPGTKAWAREDPDLRPLHDDPRFWALVGENENRT